MPMPDVLPKNKRELKRALATIARGIDRRTERSRKNKVRGVYPPLTSIREESLAIAAAVARVAWKNGLAMKPGPKDVTAYVRSQMYEPDYVPCA
jgi:malic enzyme